MALTKTKQTNFPERPKVQRKQVYASMQLLGESPGTETKQSWTEAWLYGAASKMQLVNQWMMNGGGKNIIMIFAVLTSVLTLPKDCPTPRLTLTRGANNCVQPWYSAAHEQPGCKLKQPLCHSVQPIAIFV